MQFYATTSKGFVSKNRLKKPDRIPSKPTVKKDHRNSNSVKGEFKFKKDAAIIKLWLLNSGALCRFKNNLRQIYHNECWYLCICNHHLSLLAAYVCPLLDKGQCMPPKLILNNNFPSAISNLAHFAIFSSYCVLCKTSKKLLQ